MAEYGLKIISGNSNVELADSICAHLNTTKAKAVITTFSDGEIRVEIRENIRGYDVFVIQTGSPLVNHHLMEMLVIIDALKRASARNITAVIPYFPYARQDSKQQPRVPITARLVADLICAAGAHRVLSMDLHAGQIQGFFNIPVDNLYASPVLHKYLRSQFDGNAVIVSPDTAGVERARAYAKKLELDLAIIDKRKTGPNQSEVLNVLGSVSDKVAIVLDDMIDTAGTLIKVTDALIERGASEVHGCMTHAVLSGSAIDLVMESPIKSLIVTDTIALRPEVRGCPKIVQLSVSWLVSEAIRKIHHDDPLSGLFEIRK